MDGAARRPGLPRVLVVGLWATAALPVGWTLVRASWTASRDPMLWQTAIAMLRGASSIAASAVLMTGVLALRARLVGSRRLGASIAAAGLGLATVCWLLGFVTFWGWHPGFDDDLASALLRWSYIVGAYLSLIGYVALSAASLGGDRRSWPLVAAASPLLVARIMPWPLAVWLQPRMGGSSLGFGLLTTGAGVIAAGLIHAALARGPRAEVTPTWEAARVGLDRAASALMAQVAIAVAGAAVMLIAVSSRSTALAKLMLVWLPAAAAVAQARYVGSLLHASVATAREVPAVRLALAAFCAGVTLLVTAVGLLELYRGLDGGGELDRVGAALERLSWVLPVIGVVGLLALLSALGAIAIQAQREDLRAALPVLALVVVGCTLAATALQRSALGGEHDPGAAITRLLLAAVASVATTLIMARAARRLAVALGAPAVPTAIARDRG